ncbi:hypothetical protein OM427_19575 [Halomonas sp. 18H]|uniref:class I SAM-dependent methyltransferase n=1 Tax=Halomonas almeriensis TaxID=308163 RepID=UPI002231052F|nr:MULTISPECIES: class I SAM-dependent methyltransferase [Halomonas]MCW4151720.1 hypothetical protein [Halomonas sp. 18H]MDN3553965.1 hypothetical protein [Halomonas almeriensis]
MSDESRKATARRTRLTIKPSINTLAQGSMFWQPAYLERSEWLEHLPFLFWIMEAMQPRGVVTLGTQQGVEHLALCQAVSRLGLDSRCHLVQSIKGQDQQQGAGLDSIIEYNDRSYGAFADVMDCSPVKAAGQFDDGSVDLLLLNIDVDEVELEYVFERWHSKLSPQGVVLIPSVSRRDPGYSAFREFDVLLSRFPGFAFQHGGGLGLIMVGEQPGDMLTKLLGSDESPSAQQVVRDVFARLGRTCLDAFNAREQKARAEALSTSLAEQQRQLGELTESYEQSHEALQARERELGDVKQRLDRQVENHAQERGQLAERVSLLQEYRDEMKGELTALRAKLEEQQRRQADSSAQASRLQEESHANLLRLQSVEHTLSERQDELEQLKEELQQKRQSMDEQAERIQALEAQFAQSETTRAEQESRCSELESRLSERDTALEEARASHASEKETLESQLADRQAALEAAQAEHASEKESLESQLADRQAALEAAQAEHASEKDSLESQLADRQTALEAAQAEYASEKESLENQLADCQTALEAAQAEHASEKETLESQLADRQTALEEAQAGHASEKVSLEQAQQQAREGFEKQVQELEQQLKSKDVELKNKQGEIDQRFDELGKLTKMLNETKQERDELRASVDERFEELAKLTRMLEENEQSREELQQRLSKAEQSGQEAHEKLKDSEKQRSQAQSEVDRQAKEIRQLVASLESARRPSLDVDPLSLRNELYSKQTKSRKEKAQIDRHRKAIAESPLFDAEWYLAQYPDVANNPNLAKDPARHYLLFGGYEGRNPGPGFDSNFYLANNPDVLYRGMNPLLHYAKFGEAEQRRVVPQ